MSHKTMIFHITMDGEQMQLDGLWNHHKLTIMLMQTYLEDNGYSLDDKGKEALVMNMVQLQKDSNYTVEQALPLVARAVVESFDIKKKEVPMDLNKRERRYIEYIAFKELESAVLQHLDI